MAKHKLSHLFLAQKPLYVMLPLDMCLQVVCNDSNISIPSDFDEMLHMFDDVFPKDMPHGLPPIRKIEHQIDFVPGSSLPNRPAYRANPQESEEIQKQFEDLLTKGWIRERSRIVAMSFCEPRS